MYSQYQQKVLMRIQIMKNNLESAWPPIDLVWQDTGYDDRSPLARAIAYKLSLVYITYELTNR